MLYLAVPPRPAKLKQVVGLKMTEYKNVLPAGDMLVPRRHLTKTAGAADNALSMWMKETPAESGDTMGTADIMNDTAGDALLLLTDEILAKAQNSTNMLAIVAKWLKPNGHGDSYACYLPLYY